MFRRFYWAFELIFSAHLGAAKREAAGDFSRIFGGVVTVLIALIFLLFALAVAHLGAAFAIVHTLGRSYGFAISAVCGADLCIGLLLLLRARARLSAPLLVETRATLKKVAQVIAP